MTEESEPRKAGNGDIILAKDEEGNKISEFLVVTVDDRLGALHKTSLVIQEGDIFGKTEDELLDMTADYVDSIEIVKEPSKCAEYFFTDSDEERGEK